MKRSQDFRMRLVFSEVRSPPLLDISSLLYDFELLHDLCLLLYAEEYYEYKFSNFFWFRKGRPLEQTHRLRASQIIKESPLTVELIIADVVILSGAIWAILQIIEKITNWKLNRRKMKLEIKKLEREVGKTYSEEKKVRMDLERKMHERKAFGIEHLLVRRFESNPIKLESIELSVKNDNKY